MMMTTLMMILNILNLLFASFGIFFFFFIKAEVTAILFRFSGFFKVSKMIIALSWSRLYRLFYRFTVHSNSFLVFFFFFW